MAAAPACNFKSRRGGKRDMRFFMFLWIAIEILQIAVIGILAVGYRNLQRKVDAKYDFNSRPPRSVTDE